MEAYLKMTESEKVQYLFDKLDIQHNTDSNGEIKPMLAPNKAWEPGSKIKYPQLGEFKFDGVRTFIVMTPDDTQVLSRSGKPYHKMTHLVDILDKVFPRAERTQKFIVDGELYKHGIPLTKVNEAVRGENEHSATMQFWAYDLPLAPYKQVKRSEMVRYFVEYITGHPECPNNIFNHILPTLLISDETVRAFHDEVVNLGYEGAMLKDPNGTYQPGQRSKFWQKVKMFEDNEFKIVGHECGQRGAQDLMFVCECPAGTFNAVMNGSVAEKEALYANVESHIGKMLTVKHFGYTEYGIPFLPKGKAIREEGE